MASPGPARIMKSLETHFHHHGKELRKNTASRESEERRNCHWCQIRALPTRKSAPVTIVNDFDGAELPSDFRFISASTYGDGVTRAEASFRYGCDCTDDKLCMYGGCNCLSDLADEEDESEEGATAETGAATQKKCYAYHSHGAKKGLMRSEMLASSLPLYECHEECACSVTCPNRVVERGRTLPLQVFRTQDVRRGWGLRATEDIRKGQFVDQYIGEIITPEEADRRREDAKSTQSDTGYLFALDKFSDPKSMDPRLSGAPLEVDGRFLSGPTRFINHSCDPNLRIFARVGCHSDKHIHELAFFALEDIVAGTELTFDYSGGKDDERKPGTAFPDSSTSTHKMERGEKRTYRQRNMERIAQIREQIRRGRPCLEWSLCNDPSCSSESCCFQPEWCNDIHVPDRDGFAERDSPQNFWHTMRKLTRALWPNRTGVDVLLSQFGLESFYMSPPVGHALSEVMADVWDFSRDDYGWLAEEIQDVIPFVEMLLADPYSKNNHRILRFYLDPLYRLSGIEWQRRDHFVRYMVTAELWRQRPSPYSGAWYFGTPRQVCDVLGALLLTTWTLYDFRVMERDAGASGADEQVWETWLSRYPPPRVMVDKKDGVLVPWRCTEPKEEAKGLEEVGYIGGFGASTAVSHRFMSRPKKPQRRTKKGQPQQ